MGHPFDQIEEAGRKRLVRTKQPSWVSPMLATLTDKHFSDPNWIFEPKLDGVRCLAFRKGREIRLVSRNQKNLNPTYPELEEAIEKQARDDFIVDGEIVAFDGEVTSFPRLQGRMHIGNAEEARRSPIRVYYYLFDIVYLDGYDTTHVALRDRKALLKSALRFKDPLRFMTHRHREGEAYLHAACRKGWEGLIASRRSRFMSRVEPQAGSNSSAYNSRNLLSAAIRTLSEVGSVLALCCSAITTTENSATRAR